MIIPSYGRAKAVTEPIEPIKPEHVPAISGGGGHGHSHSKTNKPVESDVNIMIKDKTDHSDKSSPNVITVHDDDPPNDFSTSELPERSYDHFTLNYSAILDESNEDNYKMKTAGVSTNNIYDHSESSDKDEDKDDNKDDEDRKTEVSISRDKPKALNEMENILEVCQWVPSDEVIERLVTKIFNYNLYSSDAKGVIYHSKRVLTDFCSKLNKKIDARVSEFKENESVQRMINQVITLSKSGSHLVMVASPGAFMLTEKTKIYEIELYRCNSIFGKEKINTKITLLVNFTGAKLQSKELFKFQTK
ncbi:hypothetical protein C1646_676774 [Rhizophagus diaphanus]|nr:hypothetical protein C1646_676774 [Rhizophagus diaphanus] [Rhizophagus sp. MUCL 43196]